MDLKSLKIFVETVNSQSFSLAAEHLFMTQPTLSKIIKSLEEELGTALFKKGDSKGLFQPIAGMTRLGRHLSYGSAIG